MFKFRKSQRIATPAQFQAVYQSKQWGGSAHFTYNVRALESADQDTPAKPATLGVTVSKKVSKRAVDRNRIKRQMREFFRHHQSGLSNTELVITAKPSCLKASDQQRLDSLSELWAKVLKWQAWHQRQLAKREKDPC